MELKLYPNLITAVTQRGHAGAIMLWTLARAVDAGGQGYLPEETIRVEALKLWSKEKYYRYRRDARDLGLVTQWGKEHNRKHEDRLTWLGLQRACAQFNVYPGTTVVLVNSSCLASIPTFKAACFCAFQAARNSDNPISRKTLKELTTVGTKTQSVYEQRNNARDDGKVKATKSFMLTGYSADHLRAAREEVHPACFLWGGEVVRPLPNTYKSTIRTVRSSRVRKIRKQLHHLVIDSGAGQGEKLFFEAREEKNAEKAVKCAEKPSKQVGAYPFRVALLKTSNSHTGCNVYKRIV